MGTELVSSFLPYRTILKGGNSKKEEDRHAWTGYLKAGEGSHPPLDRSPAGASVAAFRCSVQAIFSFKFGIAVDYRFVLDR
jgi:hypothetical protein